MNTRKLVIWITFLSIFAMATRISMDTDTWWHLRTGGWILENRAIPQTDPFSYTRADQPWQYPGWIIQVPMYLIYKAFGPGGLNLWTAAMVTLAFGFVWRAMEGGEFLRAFVLVFGATASGIYWSARPHLVSFLLAAVFLWVLEGYRKGERRHLWVLPVLMVLWANSHGGFAVGFILWGLYGISFGVSWLTNRFYSTRPPGEGLPDQEQRKHLQHMLVVGALMVLAVAVNPSGPVMLAYPFKTVGIASLQGYIQEWQSPDFHNWSVQPFAWLLLVVLGAVGASAKRISLTDFLLISVFAMLGLLAGRNVALFALVAPVVLSRHLDDLVPPLANHFGIKFQSTQRPLSKFSTRLNIGLLILIFLAVFIKSASIFPHEVNEEVFEKIFPVGAVAFLEKNQPPGRMFNSYNWGGYLLWALPAYPVFVDGRTDLYNDEILSQWFQVIRAEPGWEKVLDGWGVNLILLEKNMPVLNTLSHDEWRLLYEDEQGILYGR